MPSRCAELPHVAEEGAGVGELSCGAAHVVLLEEQLDETRVLFGGAIDILRVQKSRCEASMSDEALRVDRHCRPQKGSCRNPVLLSRKHSGAATKRVDLGLRRNLTGMRFFYPTCYRHHLDPPALPPDEGVSLEGQVNGWPAAAVSRS